jgi:DNA replication protein DnaC
MSGHSAPRPALLERRLAQAKLRHRACVEDIDFRFPRGLDRSLVRSLKQDSGWVREHLNIFLIGPTEIGKSFLACALAEKACRDGHWLCFNRFTQLTEVSRLWLAVSGD